MNWDAQPICPGRTSAQEAGPTARTDRFGVEDLTWQEVAEVLWLAAAAQPASVRVDPPPDPPEPSPVRQPSEEGAQQESRVQEEEPETGEAESRPPTPEPPPAPARPERDPPLRLLPGDLTGATPGTGWSLPDRLNIVRALKPLKRCVTARRDVVLDEIATAERAVQDDLWWPVTKHRREPWLDLTLVVDACPSMTLWRSKVDAFVELLEQLGVFGTARLRRLDTNHSAAGVSLSPVLRDVRGDTAPRGPAEVIDHSGRQVLLMITDGIGDAWHEDLVSPVLAQWGRVMPVSVIHLLPQWMWSHGGLAPQRARLLVPADLRPNRSWSVELPDSWAEPDSKRALPHDAVPVLELDPRWLRWWAKLLTGGHRTPVDAAVMLASDKPRPRVSTFADPGERTSRQGITKFRSVASPAVQRLAQLLAAVLVDLPVAGWWKRIFYQAPVRS